MDQLQRQLDSLNQVQDLLNQRNDDLQKVADEYQNTPQTIEVSPPPPVYDYQPGHYNNRRAVPAYGYSYGYSNANVPVRQSGKDTVLVYDTVRMQLPDTAAMANKMIVVPHADTDMQTLTLSQPAQIQDTMVATTTTQAAVAPSLTEMPTINIFFNLNSSTINQRYYSALNFVAHQISQHRNNYNISLSGYTDNSGAADYNLMLSKKRADAVKQYLINRGVQENQLITKFYGESFQGSSNKTTEAKVLNRRVEIKFINAKE